MIQISVFVFLILLQALVITTAVIIYLVYRNSKLKEQSAESESDDENDEAETSQPLPYVISYLAAEMEATKQQLAAQTQEENQSDQASDPIALRIEYLQLEQVWASNQERDENFWNALNDRMQELLGKFASQAQETEFISTLPMDDQDKILSQELIDNQVNTIKALKEMLSMADLDTEKSKSLKDSVEQLSQTNLELTHCVAVLEDENGFLRKQVETLVGDKPSSE